METRAAAGAGGGGVRHTRACRQAYQAGAFPPPRAPLRTKRCCSRRVHAASTLHGWLPQTRKRGTQRRLACEPFVLGPALAMERTPGAVCLRSKFSSALLVQTRGQSSHLNCCCRQEGKVLVCIVVADECMRTMGGGSSSGGGGSGDSGGSRGSGSGRGSRGSSRQRFTC